MKSEGPASSKCKEFGIDVCNTMKNIIAAGRNIISIQQKQAQTKATLTRVKKETQRP